MSASSTRLEALIEDLEAIFRKAMACDNLSVALKTREMLAKIYDLYPKHSPLGKNQRRPLSALSEEELRQLLRELEG